VQSAWVKRRRRRYFIGPYNETRELTVIAPGPYCVLPDSAPADEIGSAVMAALDASSFEDVAGEALTRLADERVLELARAAGVSAWSTFERGTRLVGVDRVKNNELLVTPNHRKRGYWEPTPERYWHRLDGPSAAELGEACVAAFERSTA
jgi:hypothetical protein